MHSNILQFEILFHFWHEKILGLINISIAIQILKKESVPL